MGCRDTFDCTPQQYHGGLDKLWQALGPTTVQDVDVFTLAAQAITRGRDLASAVKEVKDLTDHLLMMRPEGYRQTIRDAITKLCEIVKLTPDGGCLTPRQVKEGTAKVCEALGISDCDPSLMFAMAASAIDYSKHMERIIRVQTVSGPLSLVLLYPCPKCNKYTVDEWYEGNHKECSAVEVASIQEARDLYHIFFSELHEAHYVSRTDSYLGADVDNSNFTVCGSSCTCKECRNA